MNTLSSLLKFIGDTIGAAPSTLTTTSKTLVGAINEVDSDIDDVESRLKTLESEVVTVECTAGTWQNYVPPLRMTNIVNILPGEDQTSWVLWRRRADKQVTFLRISTDGQNLQIINSAGSFSLRVFYYA